MGNSTRTTRTGRWPIEPAKSDIQKSPTDSARPAGRIVHDERGNAVWSGGAADSTSTMLRRLELPGLKVEGQEETPAPESLEASKGKGTPPTPNVSGGYNPYDQRTAIRKPTTPRGPIGRKR